MAGNLTRSATRNLLLKGMSEADFALLEPSLQAIDLPLRMTLEARNKRVEHVYFLERGIASVVANGSGRPGIEVGIIGREGMTGISLLLGNGDRVPNETYIQMEGHGQRIRADAMRKAIDQSNELHRQLLHFVHAFLTQTTRTALANGRSKIEERLARWLLMACDRADGDDLRLTHEFLSIMLGVRRSGVTTALQELERRGLITYKRGIITIVDRKGLEISSNGTYLTPYAG
jgi:CRP-like cAMP-binding protein